MPKDSSGSARSSRRAGSARKALPVKRPAKRKKKEEGWLKEMFPDAELTELDVKEIRNILAPLMDALDEVEPEDA